MMLINLTGVLLIGLIVWWFWIYKPEASQVQDGDLLVIAENGVYTPSHIKVSAGQPVTLKFLRKDPSACAETVLIPDLDISGNLPLNKPTLIELPALSPGRYDFHCQMQMYRGQITAD